VSAEPRLTGMKGHRTGDGQREESLDRVVGRSRDIETVEWTERCLVICWDLKMNLYT